MKITLSPMVAEMSPGEQRTIRRALNLLAKQLREPGVAFTSTCVTRDWLRLHMTGLEREIFVVLWLDNHAKLNGHDPYVWLRDVLTRLPTWPNSRINELLPYAENSFS